MWRTAIVVASVSLLCGCRGGRNATDTWTLETHRPIALAGDSEATTAAVKDGTAFFCGGYFWNGESELFAVNVSSGEPRWHVRVGSCPHGGAVVIGSTAIALANQDHGTKHVAFGVDAASGRTLWTRDVGDVAFHAVLGPFLYLTTTDGSLRRLNGATGNIESIDSERAPEERLWIVRSNDVLLVGTGTAVWSLSDGQNDPARRPALQSRVDRVSAATADGRTLVLLDQDRHLTAFDLADGRVKWRAADIVVSAAALLGRRAFAYTTSSRGRELRALDAESGALVWSVPAGGFDPPTEADGRLYAAAGSSVLVLDANTGRVITEIAGSREVITSPVRVGDVMLYGTSDGVLHAARLPVLTSADVTVHAP